jgi:hypothetical protein
VKDAVGHVADFANVTGWGFSDLQIGTGISAFPSSGNFGTGKTIQILVNFGESITVLGVPTLTLSNGGVVYYNPLDSVASKLGIAVFDYTVGANQETNDLRVTGLSLNSNASIAYAGGMIADVVLGTIISC